MTKIRSSSTSRVQDRRGQSSGGLGGSLGGAFGGRGGGIQIPGGMGGLGKGAGGITGLLITAAIFILPRLLGSGGNALSTAPQTPVNQGSTASADGPATCDTETAKIVCGAVDHVSEYWIEQYPATFGQQYSEAPTVFFTNQVGTACGNAPSSTGPFYCPGDNTVYFDLGFMDQLLERFNAEGDLASQYIVAHEYGHHVQNLSGINAQVRKAQQQDPQRANQYSIALELQADCFAGAWAHAADNDGLLEPGEVAEALNAAAAVGDDNIQQETTGHVDQDSWTHGSSQQRMDWFQRGFDTGDPNSCNTFDEIV